MAASAVHGAGGGAGGGLAETGLLLEGLRCANCVRRTEETLRAQRGVAAATISYADHRASVTFDPAQTDPQRLVAAVAALGYQALPYDPASLVRPERTLARAALVRLLVAGFLAMNVMWLAIALYIGTYQGMDEITRRMLRWVSVALSLPAVVWCAAPFWRGALAGLRRGELSIDVPIALAIGTAFSTNVVGTWLETRHLFVDSAAWIVFLLLLGRTLERNASARAASAVDRLRALSPREAWRREGGELRRVAVSELAAGDEIAIPPGELAPVDGVLLGPETELDESALSGESTPVVRRPGELVAAGARNAAAEIALRVSAPASRGTLARTAALLERAQAERPRAQRLADRFAAVFAPAVLGLAGLTAGLWMLHGATALDVAAHATAVLIVACPCVFGLATPLASAAAIGRAARSGVLVKSGEALERLAGVTTALFDKTGTLSQGRFTLEALLPAGDGGERALLAAAADAEGPARHPIAEAIRSAARAAGLTPEVALERRVRAGRGVVAEGGGVRLAAGSRALLAELGIALPASLAAVAAERAERGETLVFVARGGEVLGALALADPLRSDARELVARLAARGVASELVSGDQPRAVERAAAHAGIQRVRAAADPEQKVAAVREAHARGERVLAVGDGLNDAAFLAAADVGVALASGSEITLAAADAVVRSPRACAVAELVALARACRARIRENFAFALLYNAFALPLAMAGILEPLHAAVAMGVSSLVVTGNSVRLLRFAERS